MDSPDWMISLLGSAGPTTAFMVWATAWLIPSMQKQLDNAVGAFRAEALEERRLHRESLEKVLEHCQEEIRTLRGAG